MENKIKNEHKSELVWAKLKYCPFWPAKIVAASPELGKIPKDKICVLFFGTNNFGFVDKKYVVDYLENRDKLVKKGRGNDFKLAVSRMEEFIADPIKYAKHGCVKPVNNAIRVKRERPSIVKKENDIDNKPFESVDVYYGRKNVHNDQQAQMDALNEEKQQLIKDLMVEKTESQKLFFKVKSQEQKLTAQETEIFELQKTIAEQKKCIDDLTRENKASRAKIKQLMITSCANDVEDEFEVEAILDHRGRKNRREFLIRWKNYTSDDDSWQPESNLNCPHVLQEYKNAKGI